MRVASIVMMAGSLTFVAVLPATACSEEVPSEYRASIAKGLEWLVCNQRKDGHWEANGGQAPVVMTALSGMALLMEGSTLREGKYHDPIRRAVDWLMQRSQPNGLITDPNAIGEVNGGYMYGHGFAMLFLSGVVGEEEDVGRRRSLVEILEKAAKFSRDAQSSRGGWYYTSSKDSGQLDEGSVTVTQLQGLRAARNAGIVVPAEAIKNGIKYLREATNPDGGVRYSLAMGGNESRKALTAAAIVCGFSTGEYNSSLVQQWLKFCRANLQDSYGDVRAGNHDEYTYYYYGQAVYMLGEDGWAKLFPEDKGAGLKWSDFRKKSFDALMRTQAADGSWTGSLGPVYTTALHLSILQLDKAVLPIYQR